VKAQRVRRGGRQTRAKKREISERPFYSFAALRLCENKKKIFVAPQFFAAGSRNSAGQAAKTPSRKGLRKAD